MCSRLLNSGFPPVLHQSMQKVFISCNKNFLTAVALFMDTRFGFLFYLFNISDVILHDKLSIHMTIYNFYNVSLKKILELYSVYFIFLYNLKKLAIKVFKDY